MIRFSGIDTFDDKYMPEPNSGCFIWLGATQGKYGSIRLVGKTLRAHRIAWELVNGKIPRGEGYHGICVLHRCDNPLCVNPQHLFLGTQKKNIHDMRYKNRQNDHTEIATMASTKIRRSQTHCKRGHLLPERNKHGSRMCLECAKIRKRGETYRTWGRFYARQRRAMNRDKIPGP